MRSPWSVMSTVVLLVMCFSLQVVLARKKAEAPPPPPPSTEEVIMALVGDARDVLVAFVNEYVQPKWAAWWILLLWLFRVSTGASSPRGQLYYHTIITRGTQYRKMIMTRTRSTTGGAERCRATGHLIFSLDILEETLSSRRHHRIGGDQPPTTTI